MKTIPTTRPPRSLSNHPAAGFRCLPSILAVAACASAAWAEVVFEDDFEGADEIEKVAVIDSKGSWEAAGGRALLGITRDAEDLNGGKALVLENTTAMIRIPLTTLEVGDSLVLTLRFRSLNEKSEFFVPLRVGLCEVKDDLPDTGGTFGYWLCTGPGAESKTSIFLEKNTDTIGGGEDRVILGEDFLLGFDWLKPQSLTLKIVRVSESLVEISTALNDAGAVVRADPHGTVTTFNLLAIRLANGPQNNILIDDVKLEAVKGRK